MMAMSLFVLGAATWLIGGNVLIAFHYSRLGQPMWTGLTSFRFPFFQFNISEWLALASLMTISLALMAFASLLDPTAPSSVFRSLDRLFCFINQSVLVAR